MKRIPFVFLFVVVLAFFGGPGAARAQLNAAEALETVIPETVSNSVQGVSELEERTRSETDWAEKRAQSEADWAEKRAQSEAAFAEKKAQSEADWAEKRSAAEE